MSKNFNVSKCSIQLRLAINRIKFHIKKKTAINESLKKEIYDLVQSGKKEESKIKILALIVNNNHIYVLKILEKHCHDIIPRVKIIGSQVTCPIDVKGNICSIIYSAPFMDYVPEFSILREMFLKKFGKDFANECVQCGCIETKIIKKLTNVSNNDSIIDNFYHLISNMKSKDEIKSILEDQDEDNIDNVSTNNDIITEEIDLLEAIILKDNNNHYWAISKKYGKEKPIYVPLDGLSNAKHGDNVVVLLDKRKDGKYSGRVECIIGSDNNVNQNDIITGKFRIDKNNHSWLISDNHNPIFIPLNYRNNACDGDDVNVEIQNVNGKIVGLVKDVLNRIESDTEEIIGIIKIDKEQNGIVFDIDNPFSPIVFVSKEHTMNAQTGTKVLVKITGKRVQNQISRIYGQVIDIIMDETLKLNENVDDSTLDGTYVSDEKIKSYEVDTIEKLTEFLIQENSSIEDGEYNKQTSLTEENIMNNNSQEGKEFVVLDIGSEYIKIGFSRRSIEPIFFPNIIGRVQEGLVNLNAEESSKTYVGHDALSKMGILKIVRPMMYGNIENFDDLKIVLESAFQSLNINNIPDYCYLISESMTNPKQNDDILINYFKSHGAKFIIKDRNSILALRASGNDTGLVIDLGHTTSSITPFRGNHIEPAIVKFNISGLDITEYLLTLLRSSGKIKGNVSFSVMEEVKLIKEKYSRVRSKYDPQKSETIIHVTSDHNEIEISDEVFDCCEVLFNPNLIGKDVIGLKEAIIKSINKCDIDLKSDLIENIILIGGTSRLRGLRERLIEELYDIYPNVNIFVSNKCHYRAWQGAIDSIKQNEPYCQVI